MAVMKVLQRLMCLHLPQLDLLELSRERALISVFVIFFLVCGFIQLRRTNM
jgi:hypothetical protein